MGAERITRHQLPGDLPRAAAVDATGDIEAGQLVQLGVAVVGQLAAFARQVRPLGIGLRADGDVFPGRHRHRTRDEPRDAGDQDA